MIRKKFQALESLRGVAALLVAFFHFMVVDLSGRQEHFGNANAMIGHFWLFTDFFFVLSGFVLSYRYFTAPFNLSDYLKARCRRLYPMHIVTTLFCVIIVSQFSAQMHGKEIVDLTITLLNLHIFFGNITEWNTISWSVSAELVGSIFCGIVFFLIAGRPRLFLPVSILIFFCCLAGLIFIGKGLDLYSGYGWIRGLAGIAAGCITYALYRRTVALRSSRPLWTLAEVISTTLCILSLYTYRNEHFYILLASFIAAIIVFAHEDGLLSNLLKHKIFQLLGKISYSIYLNQLIAFFIIEMALKSAGITHAVIIAPGNTPLLIGALALYFALLVGMSLYTYRMIEEPWRKKPVSAPSPGQHSQSAASSEERQ